MRRMQRGSGVGGGLIGTLAVAAAEEARSRRAREVRGWGEFACCLMCVQRHRQKSG
jgi:hypothetical protein